MSNIIDTIQVSGVTYTLSAETGGGGTFDLPIYSGTGTNALKLNDSGNTANGAEAVAEGHNTSATTASHAEGYDTGALSVGSHAEGYGTRANGNYSHAEGYYARANGHYSHAENRSTANGQYSHAEGLTETKNHVEHASGQYNNSVSASTTFGDSGNTLFSVGNGTSAADKHNALEIRQNGDIYLTSGGTDIKLQDHLGGGSITVSSAITSGDTNAVAGGVLYDKFDEIEQVTAAALNELNDKIEEGGGGNPTVELTQAEYDALVSAGTVSADTYYIITDAQAGDLTQYWTSAQTQSAITQATSRKQDTLVSGTNIKTVNNESILGSGNIDIQGGSTYTAGRGIDITNDTISFSLPISAGTGSNSIIGGDPHNTATNTSSVALGGWYNSSTSYNICNASGRGAVSLGGNANAEDSFTAAGNGTASGARSAVIASYSSQAKGTESFATGRKTKTTNFCELASGFFNNSVSASTTFGDSGNTLFSVGNGTSNNARHNAFEIRQNGDIYLSKDGVDIKLQDNLGGEVSSAITSGDTNAVAGGAVYDKFDEVEQVTARALNELAEADEVTARALIDLHDSLSGKAETSAVTAVQDSLSGYVATSAVTTAVTSGSTSVITSGGVYQQMGGLKLIKLSQSDYDALSPNYDNNTLYVIV